MVVLVIAGVVLLIVVLVRKGGSAGKVVLLLCGVPLLLMAIALAALIGRKVTSAHVPQPARMVLESNYPAPNLPNPRGSVQQTQNGFRLLLPAQQLASFEFFLR